MIALLGHMDHTHHVCLQRVVVSWAETLLLGETNTQLVREVHGWQVILGGENLLWGEEKSLPSSLCSGLSLKQSTNLGRAFGPFEKMI